MYLSNNNRVAAYVRLSNDEPTQQTSIENQIEIIRDYCNMHNLKLVDIYRDEGFTGSNFNRPEFKRMLTDLDRGIVNCVMTKDVSRLGRNLLQVGRYLDEYFLNNNIRYIFIMENYDSLTATQEELMGIKLFLNDYYVKECSKKALIRSKDSSTRINLTKLGVYGYLKERNNKLTVDPATAPIVKEIFERYANLESPKSIAENLNERKILSPLAYKKQRGYYLNRNKDDLEEKWTKNKVGDILKIGQYTGDSYNLIHARRRRELCYKRHQPVIVPNTHEPIISHELYNKVQEIKLQKRTKKDNIFSTKKKLSKFLYCPVCHKAYLLSVSHNLGRYADTTCKCSIKKEIVEDILYRLALKWINKAKVNYKKLEDAIKAVKQKGSNQDALLRQIESEKIDITKRSDALFEAYAMEEITKGEYSLQQETINDSLKTIEKKITDLNLLKLKEETLTKEISGFLMEVFNFKIKKVEKIDVIKMIIDKVIITKINNEIIIKDIIYKFSI